MKMKLDELMKDLPVVALNDVKVHQDVENVYIGDLLSMVMAKAKDQSVWLTVQTHVNAIAVAQMLDLSAIVYVDDLEADDDALKKANELDIPLYKTSLDAYHLACLFAQNGL